MYNTDRQNQDQILAALLELPDSCSQFGIPSRIKHLTRPVAELARE